MTILFNPSSYNFGGVETGAQEQATIEITNNGSGQVTIQSPAAPFTMSPGSVMLEEGKSTTVTITFSPGAAQSYSGKLEQDGGLCLLSGFGQSGADKFESEGDATEKHYQIAVPSFTLDQPTGSSDSKSGNSFFRMGSFPNLGEPGKQPPGFEASLKLALLVGDAAGIEAAEKTQDLDPEKTIDPSYKGDPNYLLGFCDDTRFRSGDKKDKWVDRKAATKKLLTKGGFWDHADGNRISTTSGDKIEIIQGNYKMLVLGRQEVPKAPLTRVELKECYAWEPSLLGLLTQWYTATGDARTPYFNEIASKMDWRSNWKAEHITEQYEYEQRCTEIAAGTLITDISGGLMTENGPSPTHCIKSIEFVNTGKTWEVYQNNGNGKVYSSFYGDTVDLFFGEYKATWTGRVPEGFDSADGDIKEVFKVYKKSRAMHKAPATDPQPNIIDHVWASRIHDYKRVTGDIRSDVEAKNILGTTTTTGDNTNVTNAANIRSTTTTTGDNTSVTNAANIMSTTVTTSAVAKMSASGGVTNLMTAGAVTNATAAGAVTNWTAGGLVANGTLAGGVVNLTGAGLQIANINVAGGLGPAAVGAGVVGGAVVGGVGAGVVSGGLAGIAGMYVGGIAGGALGVAASGGILNINAALGALININASATGILNIDLALANVHVGITSSDVCAYKSIESLRVALGCK